MIFVKKKKNWSSAVNGLYPFCALWPKPGVGLDGGDGGVGEIPPTLNLWEKRTQCVKAYLIFVKKWKNWSSAVNGHAYIHFVLYDPTTKTNKTLSTYQIFSTVLKLITARCRVSQKRRPMAKIFKTIFSCILLALSSQRRPGIFFNFEQRAPFFGKPCRPVDLIRVLIPRINHLDRYIWVEILFDS